MKRSTNAAVIGASVAALLVLALLIAVPILRYRIYHGDRPVFMGNDLLQRLLYHDTDIVMLPGDLTSVVYDGNTYVGDYGMDWDFDQERMQCAGKIHHRKLLHIYCNYNVYVSAQAVTEQDTPIFLLRNGGQPPFYYVLEGYDAPDLTYSELICVLYTKNDMFSLPNTAKLADLVDTQAKISYNADAKQVCYVKLYSAQYEFMYVSACVYTFDGAYYLHVGQDAYYPITSQELLDCLAKMI